jgi:subtilisin family serine protease
MRDCRAQYFLWLDTEPGFDGIVVEGSTNGTAWTEIAAWTGSSGGWTWLDDDFSAFDGQPGVLLRYRMTSDGSRTADGAYLDDVTVRCARSAYAGNEYAFFQGTSMATPHVAGVAALYLQANTGASASAVSSAVVSSATPGVVGNPGSGSPNRLLHSNVTGGGTEPPPTGCAAMPEKATGSLSGGGDLDYHPAPDGYWYAPAGTHQGCLDGPSGVDFDLYLEKWSGSAWVVVAQGISSAADENVTYSGTAGYYSWRVESYTGSGSYTFGFDRP